jgi:hypothetical protein
MNICQDCGRKNPECGFYPMLIGGIPSVAKGGSMLLCHDCEKKRRESAMREFIGVHET